MLKVFRIPLLERFTGEYGSFGRAKLIEVDGWGMYFYYGSKINEEDITPELARRYLIGQTNTFAFVEANNAMAAIAAFYREWDGAKCGGEGKDHKALMIDLRREIHEYPSCDKLHKDALYGRYICGPEEVNEDGSRLNGNGEHGGCVLEQYDPPGFFCPIYAFKNKDGNRTTYTVGEYTISRQLNPLTEEEQEAFAEKYQRY